MLTLIVIGISILLSALTIATQITKAKGIREATRQAHVLLVLGIGMVLQRLLAPVQIVLFVVEGCKGNFVVAAASFGNGR